MRRTPPAIAFLSILLLLTAACQPEQRRELPVLGSPTLDEQGQSQPYVLPDFAFVDQDSNLISQETFAGKVYVTDFFFTTCPTICPRMKAQMLRLYLRFENEEGLLLLSHTIDPRHDSVAVLKDYADKLEVSSEKWHFVTGKSKEIYAMAAAYMVSAMEDGEAPGGYIHSGAFILVDRERRVRGFYDGTLPEKVDQLMEDVELLLHATK